jgi:histidyl-tRNA synthetase
VQVSPLGEAARVPAFKLVRDLRLAGIGALLAFGGRSLKSQLKSADKASVTFTLILGDQELAEEVVIVRDMASSQQETVALNSVVDWLSMHLG